MASPPPGEIRPPSEWEDLPDVDAPYVDVPKADLPDVDVPEVYVPREPSEWEDLPEVEDLPQAVAVPDPTEDVPDPIENYLASGKFKSLNRNLNIRSIALAIAAERDLAVRTQRDKAQELIRQGSAPFTFDEVFNGIKHRIDDVEGYQEAMGAQEFNPGYLMTEIGVKGRPIDEVLVELEAQETPYMLTPAKRKIRTRGHLVVQSGGMRLTAQGKPVPERLLRPDRYNYKISSPDDDGPDVEAAVVTEGTQAYQGATKRFDAYFNEDTKRGGYYIEALEDANSSMLKESGLRDFQESIATFETQRWLEKQIEAGRSEITELHPEYDQEKKRQLQSALRVAALAHTVNRWHSPMWLSWERVTGIERPDESDHSWLRKAWDRGSRVRLELIGMDRQGVPIYRTTNPVWHVFEMSDLLQSAGVGALDHAAEWVDSDEDTGTLLDAMSKGALEGVEDRRHLFEYAMGTEWAKTSTTGAWTMGTLGFAGLLYSPDAFVGALGLAKMTKKISRGTSQWTKSGRLIRKTLDELAVGAVSEAKSAEAMARARQAADVDDWDLVERELLKAVNHMKRGEQAEQFVRKEARYAADTVDMGDEQIYLRQRRKVPDIAPKEGNALADKIPGAFGHRSENLHPSVRKSKFRGELENQLGSYRDFYNQSESIDRLVDSIRMIRRGEAEWTGELSRRIVGPHRDKLVQWLSNRGISRVALTESPEKLKKVVRFLDYLQDYDETRLILLDPAQWVDGLRDLARQLPLPADTLYKLLGDMDLSVANRTRGALDDITDSIRTGSADFAALKKKVVPDQAAMFKAIGRAISAVEANIESRSAAMAITRDLLASAKGFKVAPIMAKAANKFAQVRELSPTALRYRDQIQAAFDMTDDEATAAARFLDMLAENWSNRTNRDPAEYFAETFAPEAFKDKAAFMRRLFKPPPPYVAEDIAAASLPTGYRIEKEGNAWRVLDEADEVLGSSADALAAAGQAIDKLVELGVMTRHELDKSATRVGPLLLGQPLSIAENAIRRLNIEYAMAYTDDGVHILRKTTNSQNSVSFTTAETQRMMKALNVRFTHNHPGGGAFSDADIIYGSRLDARQIRATQEDGGVWVLDLPNGFGDFSDAVLIEKYNSAGNIPIKETLAKIEFYSAVAEASSAAARKASELLHGVRRQSAEEAKQVLDRTGATEAWQAFYSEALLGAPDADGVLRGGRLQKVFEQRGIDHSFTRLGPTETGVRVGPKSEPTFGESARRAVSEEGLDILFSRGTRDVPEAAKAVEANLKKGVLARDKDGRVIAQESPEFIDIEKVTRGPRYSRALEGTLLDQRLMDSAADVLDPPGGVSMMRRISKAWGRTPSALRREIESVSDMARLEEHYEGLLRVLRRGLDDPALGMGAEPASIYNISYYAESLKDDLTVLKKTLDELSGEKPIELLNELRRALMDVDQARITLKSTWADIAVDPAAREFLKPGTHKVYTGTEFSKADVAAALERVKGEIAGVGWTSTEQRDALLNAETILRYTAKAMDNNVPFSVAARTWWMRRVGEPIMTQAAKELWRLLGTKPSEVVGTRQVTLQEVIDQINGLPWFHGTKREQVSLLEYSLEYSGTAFGNMVGPGLYLALSPEVGIRYADKLYGPSRGVLKTVDIKVRNVLNIGGTAGEVVAQLGALVRGGKKSELFDLVESLVAEKSWARQRGSGQVLWMKVGDLMNKDAVKAKRLQEELIDAGFDGLLHDGRQDNIVLVLFDPNANSLNGAVGNLLREGTIRPERFLYQKIARQTEWEMKEIGEGLVELTSAEIRAGRAAGEAPAVAKLPETAEEIDAAFAALGAAQRGAPEEIMVSIQRGPLGGWAPVYSHQLEHVGDLTNRLGYAPSGLLSWGADAAAGKIDGAYRALHRPYGFEREFRETLAKGIKFAKEKVAEGSTRPHDVWLSKQTLETAEVELRRLGQTYADAHKQLPVYNEVQRLGNDAAIALGEFRFDDARDIIAKLKAYADEGGEAWLARASRVEPEFARPGAVAEEVMGGGLVFKVDGDVLRVQSIEIPEVLRGKGIGQELYLRALEHAKSIGKGFASDLAPSPSAIAVYERMIENGAPLTRKMVEAADGKMVQQFVASADDLRRLDVDAVRRGERVVETATETPAFKKWFGDSKVVDEAGEPLVVYHGTPKGRFDKAARETNIERRRVAAEKQRLTDEISDLDAKKSSLREKIRTLNKAVDEAKEQAIKEWRLLEWRAWAGWTENAAYKKADQAHKGARQELSKLKSEAESLRDTRRELPLYRDKDLPEEEVFRTWSSGWTDPGYRSSGAYFSESSEEAMGYARNRGTDPHVYEVYLSIKNPYIQGETKSPEGMFEEINRLLKIEKRNAGKYWLEEQRGARAKVRRKVLEEYGFDGEIWTDRGFKEYIAFDPAQIKSVKNRGTFDPLDPRILKQEIGDELRGATEFLNTGQAIIYGLNKPSFATFMHEIGHVMRRDLDEKQMETIGKWLRETEGVDIGVKGVHFEGSEAAKTLAEEKFARAFEVYIHTGEAPQPALKKIFEQMKEWLVAFYGKIVGLDVTVTPEVRKVFDEMVRQSPPKRPLLKGMAKMLKDELVGTSLRGSVKIRVMNEISREARKLGHDVSTADLMKQLDETAAADAKARGVGKDEGEGHIVLPGPVYMAGRFPQGQEKFTAREIMDVLADMEMRKRMISGPGQRVALNKRAEAIQEMTPSEIIDNFVKSEKNSGVVSWTRNVMIGGDAFEDMRYMPKVVRDAALAVPRRVEQTVGDAIHLVAEGDIKTVMKYLTGEQVVFKDSGRQALSSGHDMMGSVIIQLKRFFGAQGPLTEAERNALVDFIESMHVHKTSAEFIQSAAKKGLVDDAFAKLTSRSGSSPFVTEVLQAAGIKPGAKLTPVVFGAPSKPGSPSSIIEALTYAAGITRRAPEGAGLVKSLDDLKWFKAAQEMNTAEVFAQLYKDMRTPALFGSDPRIANRIVVLIAAYGTAAKAMERWVNLGVAVDPKTAVAFKKWIVGEALDSEADMARVLRLYQVHGFSPNFVEGMDLFGMNMYIPSKVRKRLSDALARATDPEMSDTLRGDFLEAIGSGTAVTKNVWGQRFAWLYRYLKTRMVRGNYILKTRYFTMNTFDHFNQMAMVTGFRPAFVSTTRMVTQNAISNPLGQAIIVLAGKFGAEGAAEAVRRKLQSAGDLGAHWASRILMGSKWRLDLNMVLEGKGMFNLGGNVYSGKQIRDIALEAGIFSSFDTSQLGIKIQKSIDLFLEGAKKDSPDFYRKFKRFADHKDLYRVAQDIAEGWSERERLGAMLTMMEMGMDPHTAANVTIKALYDYAGSMSKWDRNFVINMFLPFWAFQKNANRQLIDTVFSPWGAYRLGIMRRAWEHGPNLISDMMYFDMVDEYGVNTKNMPLELRDAYYKVKLALLNHYETPDAIPDEVHHDIALWVTGKMASDLLVSRHQWTGTELQNALMQVANQRITGYYVPQPKGAHRKGFRRIRPGFAIPHEYTVNMRKFIDGVQVADPSTPYSFVMTPEPVYTAAFNHMGNMMASMILLGHKLVKRPMSMIEEDDGTDILAQPITPLMEVFSPQRAPLFSELLAEFGMDEGVYPVRLHESLVGIAEAHGVEVFPTTAVEDPFATEEERKKALEDSREALGFVGVTKRKRYYMQPGVARLIFVNNPIGEYNRLLMSWEKTPLEEAAKQGEALKWARMVGLDVEEVWPSRTVRYEARRAREELGSEKVYEKARKGRKKKAGEK